MFLLPRCESFNTIQDDWAELIRWQSLVRISGYSRIVAINAAFSILYDAENRISRILRLSREYGTHVVVCLNSKHKEINVNNRQFEFPWSYLLSEYQGRYIDKIYTIKDSRYDRFLIACRPDVYITGANSLTDLERKVIEENKILHIPLTNFK